MMKTILALILTAAPPSHPFTIRVAGQGGGFSVDLTIVGRAHARVDDVLHGARATPADGR